MDYRHPETEHMIDEVEHNECVELAKELLDDATSKGYPEHIIDLLTGIVGELEEYEQDEMDEEGRRVVDEDDMSDDELQSMAHKEMAGEKPMLMIKIKTKK